MVVLRPTLWFFLIGSACYDHLGINAEEVKSNLQRGTVSPASQLKRPIDAGRKNGTTVKKHKNRPKLGNRQGGGSNENSTDSMEYLYETFPDEYSDYGYDPSYTSTEFTYIDECWDRAGFEGKCKPLEDCSRLSEMVVGLPQWEKERKLRDFDVLCPIGEFCCTDNNGTTTGNTPTANLCWSDEGGEGMCRSLTDCPLLLNKVHGQSMDTRLKTLQSYKMVCGSTYYCCPELHNMSVMTATSASPSTSTSTSQNRITASTTPYPPMNRPTSSSRPIYSEPFDDDYDEMEEISETEGKICKSANSETTGICKKLEDCEVVTVQLKNGNNQDKDKIVFYHRSADCDESAVCCKEMIDNPPLPSSIVPCTFSGGRRGICKTVEDCPALQQSVKDLSLYAKLTELAIYRSLCDPGEYCCEGAQGLIPSTTSTTTTTTTTTAPTTSTTTRTTTAPTITTKKPPISTSTTIRTMSTQKFSTTSTSKPMHEMSTAGTSIHFQDEEDNLFGIHRNYWLLPEASCGKLQKRKSVSNESSPWSVLLRRRSVLTGVTSYVCLGALISKKYVIGPAHCLSGPWVPFDSIIDQVRIGGDGNESSIQDIAVDERTIHPNYKPLHRRRRTYNDVALLRLARDAAFNVFAQPACLPRQHLLSMNFEMKTLVSVVLDEDDYDYDDFEINPRIQTKKNAVGVKNKFCSDQYRDIGTSVRDSQMCVSSRDQSLICGSEGLLFYNENDRMFLTGLKSFGSESCTLRKLPIIYTRLDTFINWFLDNMYE